jgi:acyl carrier protein
MNDEQILREMNEVFRKVLDVPELVIDPTTTAKDVPEWDSLSHIQLIAAVEKHFKLRFLAAEIQAFKNVGDMTAGIARKLRSR